MRAPAVLSFFVLAATLAAQHGSNPAVAVDQSSGGAKLFRAQCSGCHGPDGSGTGAGPSLDSGVFRHGASDEAVVHTISKGVAGTTMPAFSYDAGQMWQLVAHIRSMSIVRAAYDVKGDAKAGGALFRTHCAGCHALEGSLIGPSLMGVGGRRSAAELRQAIVDPGAVVLPEYWSVAGKTASGQAIGGTRLNEDTSSIQLRDRSGRLFSVLKKDLVEFNIVRTSPMPSFKGKLSDAQIDDAIAFLVKGDR